MAVFFGRDRNVEGPRKTWTTTATALATSTTACSDNSEEKEGDLEKNKNTNKNEEPSLSTTMAEAQEPKLNGAINKEPLLMKAAEAQDSKLKGAAIPSRSMWRRVVAWLQARSLVA